MAHDLKCDWDLLSTLLSAPSLWRFQGGDVRCRRAGGRGQERSLEKQVSCQELDAGMLSVHLYGVALVPVACGAEDVSSGHVRRRVACLPCA